MNHWTLKNVPIYMALFALFTACQPVTSSVRNEQIKEEQQIQTSVYGTFTEQQQKLYVQANNLLEKNKTDAAIDILTTLAQQGQMDAQNALGFVYIKQQKVLDAKQWFEKAAVQNHPEAQNNLGMLYLQGIGVAPNEDKAREWFEKAAAQNNASAQNNLGMMYMQGLGVKVDYAQAKEYLEKAAAQNNSLAQYNLAMIYLNGLGEPVNIEKAKIYLQQAAQQGDMQAKQQLTALP